MHTIKFKIVEEDSTGGSTERYMSLEELTLMLSGVQLSAAELSYLDGVTSPIQDQFDAIDVGGGIQLNVENAWLATQTFSNIIDGGLTADTVPYADAQKQLTSSAITPTELSYLDGVTSAIQTQLDGKQATVTSSGTTLTVAGANLEINLTKANSWTGTQTFSNIVVTQPVTTGGATTPAAAVIVTGAAHNTAIGAVEAVDVNINLARVVTFTQIGISTQRAIRIQAPTYAFSGGVATIGTAATLAISGPPIVGNNAAITNAYPLWIESGRARFDGGLHLGSNQTATNSGTFTFSNTVAFTGSFSSLGTLTLSNAGTQACILIQPSANTNLTQEVFQIRANSASASLFAIRRNGIFSTQVHSAPADGDLAAGEAAFWFDQTDGLGKLMVKAKTADGTVATGSIALV